MKHSCDVAIIGAGIAGASLAYRLTQMGVTDVVVLERESAAGYHTSGRSAQVFLTFSLDSFERRVTVAAGEFLRQPPAGFVSASDQGDAGLFRATGVLLLFDPPDLPQAFGAARALNELGHEAVILSDRDIPDYSPVPDLRPAAGAVYLPRDGRLRVPLLLDSYLRGARDRGAEVLYQTTVTGVRRKGDACAAVITDRGELASRVVVNAAGPWAGQLAELAGASKIAMRPSRRTVITFAAPAGVDVSDWPLVGYESRKLYFAPEGGGLLASPMDEEPMSPGDARADPAVIAQTRARLAELVPSIAPAEVHSVRAGLRTFAPDDRLIIGEDPALRGFFWLAGQGGWGIESSPVISQIAAEILLRGTSSWPEAAALSPSRFVS
ncbi:MAG: FAD-binding oxidoreductase [Proteobacteria bacterium]|nr:FAD-binding oxidoreductase [Pseudomonadota bacterium]